MENNYNNQYNQNNGNENGNGNGYGNQNQNQNQNQNANGMRRLYRSNLNKMICGVCGGIGNYFNCDPTIIRLLMVLFAFFSFGTGVVAYFIMAIVIPTSPYNE